MYSNPSSVARQPCTGRSSRRCFHLALVATVSCAVASEIVSAQPAPLQWDDVAVMLDSGALSIPDHAESRFHVAYSQLVGWPGADWVRLEFGEVQFSGSLESGTNARLRITSLDDGGQQILDARSIQNWSHTSAYFNGSWVLVELLTFAGTEASRVTIENIQAGRHEASGHFGLCNGQDDRLLIDGPPDGRTFPTGCTAFLIGERCFLSAGHCSIGGTSVVHFNLPMSSPNGALNFAHPDDQYPLDGSSIQLQNDAPVCDNDWAYYGVFDNSNTGLSPFEAQGEHYTLAGTTPSPAGQTVRVRGYGQTIHAGGLPLSWNQVLKIAKGPFVDLQGTLMFFQADVSGGDSGSALFDLDSGEVIGIVTCNGCDDPNVLANRAMAIHQANLQSALANPQGVCIPTPIVGDLNGDGVVDVSDLLILLANWGPCPGSGPCLGDINNDETVDVSDLLILLANWG